MMGSNDGVGSGVAATESSGSQPTDGTADSPTSAPVAAAAAPQGPRPWKGSGRWRLMVHSKCVYCGDDHDDQHCTNRYCISCSKFGHGGPCFARRTFGCSVCSSPAHKAEACPWVVQPSTSDVKDCVCMECGKAGHTSCSRTPQPPHISRVVCSACGYAGHVQSQCQSSYRNSLVNLSGGDRAFWGRLWARKEWERAMRKKQEEKEFKNLRNFVPSSPASPTSPLDVREEHTVGVPMPLVAVRRDGGEVPSAHQSAEKDVQLVSSDATVDHDDDDNNSDVAQEFLVGVKDEFLEDEGNEDTTPRADIRRTKASTQPVQAVQSVPRPAEGSVASARGEGDGQPEGKRKRKRRKDENVDESAKTAASEIENTANGLIDGSADGPKKRRKKKKSMQQDADQTPAQTGEPEAFVEGVTTSGDEPTMSPEEEKAMRRAMRQERRREKQQRAVEAAQAAEQLTQNEEGIQQEEETPKLSKKERKARRAQRRAPATEVAGEKAIQAPVEDTQKK